MQELNIVIPFNFKVAINIKIFPRLLILTYKDITLSITYL
jgi:hypothetical protein